MIPSPPAAEPPPRRLLDQVRDKLRKLTRLADGQPDVTAMFSRQSTGRSIRSPAGSNATISIKSDAVRRVTTTQIYTHVLQRGGSAVQSPVDALLGVGVRHAAA